jgi:hypothetical protein
VVEKSWKHLASTFLPMNELIALLGHYPERDHEKLLLASPSLGVRSLADSACARATE